MPTLLLAVHMLANVVWIGSLLAVALLAARAPSSANPAEIGGLARYVHLRLAAPAFMVSFVAGLGRIILAPSVYAHLPWFHAKLTFALVVVVVHHIIGARAKRLAAGKVEAASGMPVMAAITLAAAAATVFLGVAKGFAL